MIRHNLTMLAAVVLAAAVIKPLDAQNIGRAAAAQSGPSLAAEPNPTGQYATSELEDMRTQLLNLENALEQFAPLTPPNSVDLNSLQQAKARIQQMPYQHLNSLRRGLSPSGISSHLGQARQHMQNFLSARGASRQAGNRPLLPQQVSSTPPSGFPVPGAICDPATKLLNQIQGTIESDASGGLFGAFGGGFDLSGSTGGSVSFGVLGSVGVTISGGISYTPGSASTAGISNTGTVNDYTQNLANIRISSEVVLAADAVWFVADSIREFSQDACGQDILGENVQLACLVTDALWVVAKAVDEGIHFCDDDLTASVGDSIYGGLALVYTNMYTVGNALDTHITSANTDIDTHVTSANTDIDNKIVHVNTDIDSKITALASQLTLSGNQITTGFATITQQINNVINCVKGTQNCAGASSGGTHTSVTPAQK